MSANRARYDHLISFIRQRYGEGFIPLHRPVFAGNEKTYMIEAIESNFVSSVGQRVSDFETMTAAFTGARYAIATVNGTAALHASLVLAGVKAGDEVISQALTFVATCNAICYMGAKPVFVDVDRDTLGLSPSALRYWLMANAEMRDCQSFNRKTGAHIAACVPMHTFGLPLRIAEVANVCREWGIPLIEDSAESLGSYTGAAHTGNDGLMSALSFNGNKVITTGGGGMILTGDEAIAKRAKHLTTTAKVPHPYEFVHDEVGFNYRLPNLNAALGCAQMETLPSMLAIKREIAEGYRNYCGDNGWTFIDQPAGTSANFWLNAILLNDRTERDTFLEHMNARGIMVRPIWRLMSSLEMFRNCQTDGLENSQWLEDRVVNLPSGVPDQDIGRVHV